MAQSVCLVVSAGDRARLEAIVADRNRPQKHVARARLVLLSADRLDVAAIARRAGISRPAVWRWQRRGTVKLSSKGTEKRGSSLELRIYAAALAPVISAHIAKACARTARYSTAGR